TALEKLVSGKGAASIIHCHDDLVDTAAVTELWKSIRHPQQPLRRNRHDFRVALYVANQCEITPVGPTTQSGDCGGPPACAVHNHTALERFAVCEVSEDETCPCNPHGGTDRGEPKNAAADRQIRDQEESHGGGSDARAERGEHSNDQSNAA